MRYNQPLYCIFDQAKESHRHAYNAVFGALGLSWHWDLATYSRLQATGSEPVRNYLENEQAHLLRAYDADFLVNLIESSMAKCDATKKTFRHISVQPSRLATDALIQLSA